MEDVRVPKDRIAVLIGPKGETKKEIEINTETELSIDSETGLVSIQKKENAKDPLGEWKAKDVIKAIARGFNPEIALRICEEDDCIFEIVDLKEFVSAQHLERIRGRIIGREGKAKKYIEEMTKTDMVIYGKTVGIIGQMQDVAIAKEAVSRLAGGQEHSTVMRFLQNVVI
ncbi:KH domain-containing protein [Candidatus Undinarchaeota archaeon]